jgi:hypothetical protein
VQMGLCLVELQININVHTLKISYMYAWKAQQKYTRWKESNNSGKGYFISITHRICCYNAFVWVQLLQFLLFVPLFFCCSSFDKHIQNSYFASWVSLKLMFNVFGNEPASRSRNYLISEIIRIILLLDNLCKNKSIF